MARDFNGTSDRIDYGLPFDTTAKPVSIVARARFDLLGPGASSRFLFNAGDASGSVGTAFGQRATTNGSLQFLRACATTNRSASMAADQFVANQWYIVGVSDAGTLTVGSTALYINGANAGLGGGDTAGVGGETAATGGWSVGGRVSADDRNHDGKVAWIAVFDRALTPGEQFLIGRGGHDPRDFAGLRFWADYRMGDYRDAVSLRGLLDGTRPYDIGPVPQVYSRGARVIGLFGGAAPTVTGVSDSDTLIDESLLTITGTALASATAVTIKQTGRPDFAALSFVTSNSSTEIQLTGLDVQDMGMAYGAATIEVTTSGGTSAAFPITIAEQASHQYITLAGHTSGSGIALGDASANGDQYVVPFTTTLGGTIAFVGVDGTYTITYPGSAPSNDTFYRAWFDDSADQWYEGTVTVNPVTATGETGVGPFGLVRRSGFFGMGYRSS